MRVLICGAGKVGFNIASYLSREDNDITIIDHNPDTIARVNEELDANGVLGHASSPEALASAGASDADMIIAVTQQDEVNMVACQVAHSLFNVPKKIARIREKAYRHPAWSNLFSRAHMPIDVIISPEYEVARAITMRLSVPGTTNIIPLADGRVHMASVICEENCPVVNTPLRQLTSLFPDVKMEIITIRREGRTIVPRADDQMHIGDEVYFVTDTNHIQRVLSVFGHEESKARNVVLMGGGGVGASLVREIQEHHKEINIKIIESDPVRAIALSEEFDNIIILNGDGLDRALLEEANISESETFVAITDDDEANILGSLLAKQHDVNRVITLVNKDSYSALISSLGVGAIVSPRSITASMIMQHVRRGRIKAVHNLGDGFAELIEVEASETTDVINRPLKEITFPHNVIVGAIVRDGDVIMPRPESMIRAGDHVIILASAGEASKVEKMFSVQVDIFN